MHLLAELRRRNVIRMAGLYLVGAWLAVQVFATLLPVFEAPAWVMKAIVGAIAIGFLPAMVFAWIYELTPEGFKRDAEVPAGQSIGPATARRIDRAIIAVLLIALGYFAVDKFLLQRTAPPSSPVSAAAQPPADSPAADPKSIAVLPFTNMSGEAENGYFADGISEEILNSLARIDGLPVVGRTSSFQFKGRNEDSRVIGGKLGVANLLEGSVRREGQRARITAQLIRAADGLQLWSDSYDRTLEDTLAVQLDIAEKVAAVLDVVLDAKQRARMREAGVRNVDAYIAYQKGLKLFDDAHTSAPGVDLFATLARANEEFGRATALEPNLTRARILAADMYYHRFLGDSTAPAPRAEAWRLGIAELDGALRSSRDEAQRAEIEVERQVLGTDWRGLRDRIERALASTRCDQPDWLPQIAVAYGYAKRVETRMAELQTCDPLSAIPYARGAEAALWSGSPEGALEIVHRAEQRIGAAGTSGFVAVRALAAQGKFAEAQATLQALASNNEFTAIAQLVLDAAQGADPATIKAHVAAYDHTAVRFDAWDLTDTLAILLEGNRAEANRRFAVYDTRPGGALTLTLAIVLCTCGAPFDLDALPNFKARIAESGLPWPPAQPVPFRRAAETTAVR
jgi:TolB-like protein